MIEIRNFAPSELERYAEVSIAFEARSVLRVEVAHEVQLIWRLDLPTDRGT